MACGCHKDIRRNNQIRTADTSRQMRQSQFSLQNLAAQLTIGIPSSVFSDPCLTFIITFSSKRSNLVHTYLISRIAKVHLPHRKDSIRSLTTIFRYAHFPKNCDFLRMEPAILKRSSLSSSIWDALIFWPIRASFWMRIWAKRRQRSSFTSSGTCMRNLAYWGRPLVVSQYVSHRHFWYSSQATFILVTLLSRMAQPFENCSSPAVTLHLTSTVLPPKIMIHSTSKSSHSSFLSLPFSRSAEGDISTFLNLMENRSSSSDMPSSRQTRLTYSSSINYSSPKEIDGIVREALEVQIVVSSSGHSAEITRLKVPLAGVC